MAVNLSFNGPMPDPCPLQVQCPLIFCSLNRSCESCRSPVALQILLLFQFTQEIFLDCFRPDLFVIVEWIVVISNSQLFIIFIPVRVWSRARLRPRVRWLYVVHVTRNPYLTNRSRIYEMRMYYISCFYIWFILIYSVESMLPKVWLQCRILHYEAFHTM